MGVTILLLLLGACVVWLLAGKKSTAEPGEAIEPVDREELEAAEREVRDLDVNARPEDGFQGDDWGPGAGGVEKK